MTEPNTQASSTVPDQPEARPPLHKAKPLVFVLISILLVLLLTNLANLFAGHRKSAPPGSVPMRPVSPNAQQVASFESQQRLQAQQDAELKQRQKQLAAALDQLPADDQQPGLESSGVPPMTAAQRDAIYGSGSNTQASTSNASEVRAEAKQRALAREKQRQDALNSATVAIDFARSSEAEPSEAAPRLTHTSSSAVPAVPAAEPGTPATTAPQTIAATAQPLSSPAPMAAYPFDQYQGDLYRIFEGTVLEGVVTNHIDGGLNGPILVMLTTDYYSHDHQQLLMPQGTRLIGNVQSVGNAQQRKLFVTFHRAVCPDGFSLDFDRYLGLDPVGTTGLATQVNHGYWLAFGAAAALGGLGGMAQMGNSGSALDPSAQIRSGISSQSAAEAEQILNHFLDRLPVITLKEGARARVYIGRDILVPSYAAHRINPAI